MASKRMAEEVARETPHQIADFFNNFFKKLKTLTTINSNYETELLEISKHLTEDSISAMKFMINKEWK